MIRWLALTPLVVLALLGVLFWGHALRRDPHVDPAALVGRPAPDLMLQPLEGGSPKSIRAPSQGPVLVNFFASWCAPCIQEAPALMALKLEGVPIVGVAYKDAPDASRRFLSRYGDPFQSVLTDPEGRAGIEYGVSGVPETFAIGRDGRVKAKHSGPLTPQAAEAMARALGR